MKDYTFDVFDTVSLNVLINNLKELNNKLKHFNTYIIDKFLSYGLEVARENVEKLGIVDTGRLKSCISVRKRGNQNVGYIYVFVPDDDGNNYATYVEFGTGFIGKGNSHPKSSELNYKYDINNHGQAGWFYPTKKDGEQLNSFETSTGDRLVWTQGQTSKPFMYNTAVTLQENVVRLVKETLEL